MPERGVHLGRDLLGNAGAKPHNHDLSASSLGCGEVRQAGQRQRDVSKGGFRGVQCGPVSYTHLDVYKRQGESSGEGHQSIVGTAPEQGFNA